MREASALPEWVRLLVQHGLGAAWAGAGARVGQMQVWLRRCKLHRALSGASRGPARGVSSLALAHRTPAAGILSPPTDWLPARDGGVLAHAPSCTARTTQAHIVEYAPPLFSDRFQSVAIGGRGQCVDGGTRGAVEDNPWGKAAALFGRTTACV